MRFVPAGPITGRELVWAIQGGDDVLLTRAQVSALLGKNALPTPRPFNIPTTFAGEERIKAVQAGSLITMTPADLTAFLSGTAASDPVPLQHRATEITGEERIMGSQSGWAVAFSSSEAAAIGTPALAIFDDLLGGYPYDEILSSPGSYILETL